MSKQYIVSGSNGFLGEKVVSLLVSQGKKVIGLCRNKGIQNDGTVKYVLNDEFLTKTKIFMKEKTVFIHLAFARANREASEIAESLDFTKNLLKNICKSEHLERFIYISSQGIYGKSEKIRKVSDRAEPESIYSMAKYAAEKMVEMAFDEDKDYCILRLDNIIQSQNLVKTLFKSAISKGRIDIIGGKQVFSYIDGDDAADAIVLCACSDKRSNRHIYNVGPNRMRISLIEIVEIVKKVITEQNNIEVIYNPDDTVLWAGMDSEDFCVEYNWKPEYDIVQMIERVYKEVWDTLERSEH